MKPQARRAKLARVRVKNNALQDRREDLARDVPRVVTSKGLSPTPLDANCGVLLPSLQSCLMVLVPARHLSKVKDSFYYFCVFSSSSLHETKIRKTKKRNARATRNPAPGSMVGFQPPVILWVLTSAPT